MRTTPPSTGSPREGGADAYITGSRGLMSCAQGPRLTCCRPEGNQCACERVRLAPAEAESLLAAFAVAGAGRSLATGRSLIGLEDGFHALKKAPILLGELIGLRLALLAGGPFGGAP